MKQFRVIGLLAFLLTYSAYAYDHRTMSELASALTFVSSSVQATISTKNPANHLNGRELLSLSVAHDSGLLRRFKDYSIDVTRHGDFAIILVCDEQKRFALLEDVTCTPGVDRPHWDRVAKAQCRLTYSPAEISRMYCRK